MKHYLDPEGRRVGWLLTELERQTEDRLSDESRKSLIGEVECHLDAAIQARLELGMSQSEAEIEAVEAFGHPKQYVDDILRIHERSQNPQTRSTVVFGEKRTMAIFWIGTILSAGLLVSGFKSIIVPGIIVGLIAVAPFFGYYSFKARRIQAAPIFFASFVACLALTTCLSFTWHNLWAHDGMGVIPRWEAAERKKADERTVAQLESLIVSLRHHDALHRKFQNPLSLTRATVDDLWEFGQIPVLSSNPKNTNVTSSLYTWQEDTDLSIKYKYAGDLESYNRAWDKIGTALLDHLERRQQEASSRISAIAKAQAAPPLADWLPNFGQLIVAVPAWFALWGTVNFLFGGLGWLLNRPTYSRRRKVA